MKLKMKFYQIIEDLTNNPNRLYMTSAKKAEKIADAYCISFAYWLTDSRIHGSIEIEELLKIYKKECKL